MKYFLLLSFTLLIGCTTPQQNEKSQSGIVEENDMCICMEVYEPVCGKDGKTYGNACEANCKKVKYTEGECR